VFTLPSKSWIRISSPAATSRNSFSTSVRLDVLALGGAEEDVDDGRADDSVREVRVGVGEREPLRDAEGRRVLARERAVDLGETARVVRVAVRGKHGDRLGLRDGALHVEAFVEAVQHFGLLR
jgi:hypothetical protein